MAIDPTTESRLIEYLKIKWRGRGCPMCGTAMWNIYGHVTISLSDTIGQASFGGPALPCAAVACQGCGNTLLVNLAMAGIVPRG